MMTNKEFVAKLKDIATNYKTLYVMGCFGAPMTAANKRIFRYPVLLPMRNSMAAIIGR